MREHIQELLDRIRPFLHGRNTKFSARFGTSDILQESAIQLLSEAEKRQADQPIPQTWLTKIGRGTASKLRQKHSAARRSVAVEHGPPTESSASSLPSPDAFVSGQELSSKLVRCLARLKHDQREIIHRYVSRQESFNSIAKQLDLPPHQIRRIYKKSLLELKSLMNETD